MLYLVSADSPRNALATSLSHSCCTRRIILVGINEYCNYSPPLRLLLYIQLSGLTYFPAPLPPRLFLEADRRPHLVIHPPLSLSSNILGARFPKEGCLPIHLFRYHLQAAVHVRLIALLPDTFVLFDIFVDFLFSEQSCTGYRYTWSGSEKSKGRVQEDIR